MTNHTLTRANCSYCVVSLTQGLSYRQGANGEHFLYVVSDDNFHANQKTLLLQLQLLDNDATPQPQSPAVGILPSPPPQSTQSPPPSPPTGDIVDDGNFATGLMVGIVVILLLAALAGLGLFLHRRKQKQRRKFFLKRLQMEEYDASDR